MEDKMKCRKLTAAVVLLSCATALYAAEWYEGGTLHRAIAKDWHRAPISNRLATSADFAAAIGTAKTMDELKNQAIQLERCITTGTDDQRLKILQVSEVAAACAVILGYK